ncbi:MAG: NAD(P)-binding domain-containing protein, partial [Deltaproteobacteria bacterium]|nr:NAD(P)-binding domain-containing protein [Deltaproteobacteria bacterium]
MANKNSADVGLIGLAVMGQNLALNMADHGFEVAVFNRTSKVTKDFVDANPNTPGGLFACESLSEFLGAVKKPRKIVILVKAGPAVDAVAKQLIEAGIEKEDLLVDCGNSQWTDTIRREQDYSGRCRFFGSGVSGGEIGARFGPSLMPGGDFEAWKLLEPIWNAIAAKVDAATGKPIETA